MTRFFCVSRYWRDGTFKLRGNNKPTAAVYRVHGFSSQLKKQFCCSRR